MTWTTVIAGNYTVASLGAEEVMIPSQSVNGTYVLETDLANLARGEQVHLYVHLKTNSGSASGRAYSVAYRGGAGSPNKLSVPIPVATEIVIKMKQVGGTPRAIGYALRRV